MAEQPREQLSTDSINFLLGRIVATLEAMPARMDRFEATTTQQLSDIRNQIADAINPLATRVEKVESVQQKQSTTSARQAGIIGTAGALIGAGLSGFITKMLH